VILLALSTPARAQEAKEEQKKAQTPEEKGWITKIFHIKHHDVYALRNVLRSFGADIEFSRNLRVIAVTGKPATVAAVGDAIQRLDIPQPPPKNVEVTFYLLLALQQATESGSVPKALEGVTRQLKKVFSYQGFRVLDTMIVRARDGEQGHVSGAGPAPSGGAEPPVRTIYHVAFNRVGVMSDEEGHVIRIDGLNLGASIPGTVRETGFRTDIDVHEGQKVVVGKANIDTSNNAMILVVTARVVE
jgi:hypothetical protein